jgi:hypothetical protein
LVEETGVSGENLWPAASHNVVSKTTIPAISKYAYSMHVQRSM